MALGLNRIWVRFGLWIRRPCCWPLPSLAIGVLAFSELQYREVLPPPAKSRQNRAGGVEVPGSGGQPQSPLQIYSEYWKATACLARNGRWSSAWLSACLSAWPWASGFRDASPVRWPPWRPWLRAWSVAIWPPEPSKGNAHGEMAEMIDAFNGMVDSLETLEAERLATAASISHELRTPLTVLQARLHAICDGVIDPARPR